MKADSEKVLSPLRGAFSIVQFCTFRETKYILVTSIFVSLSATFFVCLPISLKQKNSAFYYFARCCWFWRCFWRVFLKYRKVSVPLTAESGSNNKAQRKSLQLFDLREIFAMENLFLFSSHVNHRFSSRLTQKGLRASPNNAAEIMHRWCN